MTRSEDTTLPQTARMLRTQSDTDSTQPKPASVAAIAALRAGRPSARPRTQPTTACSRKSTFDEVAALSVESVSKSAIARVKRISWNTVNRWLERATASCRQLSDRKITGLEIPEIQADEIRTFAGGKDRAVWIFASLDVSSRLWPSTVVGRRSYRNTQKLFKDTLHRMNDGSFPLIVTDGFEYYAKVVRRLFGISCLYGQLLRPDDTTV